MSQRWPSVKVDSLRAIKPYSLVGGPFGSNLTTRDYVEEGVPVIRGSNLPDEREFEDDGFVFVADEKANSLTSNLAYPGDVVFTQRGTLGQVGIIPASARFQRYVISQSQMKLTVNEKIASSRFIYYFFRHPNTVQEIKNRSITSGVPHINLGILKDFSVPLPPLYVQSEIVEVLSSYDDLIENNRRRMALLEDSARLLYREWFVRLRFPGYEHTPVVDAVPQGWEKKSTFDVFNILSGGTPKTSNADYWDGEIPFYTPKDSTDGIWVTECERRVSALGVKNCNSKLYPKGTVFISARGTVGKLNMAQRSMAMSQSCYALTGKAGLNQRFVYSAMQAAVQALQQQAVGAVFDAIVVDTFKRISLLIPTITLLDLFDEAVAPMFEQVENLTLQNQKLRAARDLLLPRLMGGEIAV